ncbi:MAG: hypothetical protein GVY15_07785, partial [Bacteroidetes bacterium]|nr:hypothetical protein [Bacteroidota bacterium]
MRIPCSNRYLLTHVEVLAHDSLQGRDAGTEGAAMARAYLREQLAGLDLQTFEGGLEQRFTFPHRRAEEEREGVNLMAYIEGQVVPDTFRAGGAGHLYSMGRAREGCKPSSFMRGIRGPSRC